MPRAPLLGELSAKQTERFLRNSAQKEDPLSELQLREGVFFCFGEMLCKVCFCTFIICHPAQKSSGARKVYKDTFPLWQGTTVSEIKKLSASSVGLPGSPVVLRTRVAAPSVCFGPWCGPRILLAAAPTATPCFRRWRRSSLLLLTRGGFGSRVKLAGYARGSPTRGAGGRKPD